MASTTDPKRQGGWLPGSQEDLEGWLRGRREAVADKDAAGPLHPAVEALRDLIEGDAVLRMHAHRMIEQEPEAKGYSEQPLESVEQMLLLIDALLTTAPEFGEDMVSTPLGAILDWTMGTPAGFAFYRDPRVNDALRGVLDAWKSFLDGRDSLTVLNGGPSGWTSEKAVEAIGIDQYRYDPDDPHWGFASWNDFFTRRFREESRPVAAPEDDAVITAVCEATSYRIATDVQHKDDFWAKNEAYSLTEMLAGDDAAEAFTGGTVYQAFLGPTDYHRWHSPVAGRVVRAFRVQGTYYSEADSQGQGAAEPMNSQAYLAHVATRAVLILDADDPAIGLVGIVLIGMSDVSSCEFSPHVRPGAHLAKGDEFGMFQYGGSTYCLAFRPDVIGDFAVDAVPQPDAPTPHKTKVRSRLARTAAAG